MATPLIISSQQAMAADALPAMASQPQDPGSDRPAFSFAPYLWIAGISGDTAVFGLPVVHSSESFTDLLKEMDFGFMGAGEVRFENFSLLTDISYARISSDAPTPMGVYADSVSLEQQTFSGLAAASHTVLGDESSHLDVVGGVKVWWTETTIGFSGGPLDGVSGRDEAAWVDAMAGFRGVHSLTPDLYLTGWGLVGAGGADLDWDAMAGLGYNFKNSMSAVVGYRALGVDYSRDGLTNDIVEHGPMLGLVVHF